MKTKILVFTKEMILPAFWLFFFVAFSGSKLSKVNKATEIKKVENLSTSSEAINTTSNNNNSTFHKAAIYISNL